jgi:serine/arginine repetitive matrix protein 2
MSYNGVGILTPRGTGTSGHVQTNKFNLRRAPVPKFQEGRPGALPAADKKPNQEILEHNRKRQVEVKLLELQDELEAQGWVSCCLQQRRSHVTLICATAAAAVVGAACAW